MNLFPYRDCGKYCVLDFGNLDNLEARNIEDCDMISHVAAENHFYENFPDDPQNYGALSNLLFSNFNTPGVTYSEVLESVIYLQKIFGALLLGRMPDQKVAVLCGPFGGNSKGKNLLSIR